MRSWWQSEEPSRSSGEVRSSLALALAVLLGFPAPALSRPDSAPRTAGVPIGLVIRGSEAAVNDIAVVPGTTVFSGDQISTGSRGWVLVLLQNGDYFALGDGVSQARVERVSGQDLFVSLRVGVLTIATPKQALFRVETPCASVVPQDPRDSLWQVAVLDANTTEVAAHRSSLQVRMELRQLTVLPRERIRI